MSAFAAPPVHHYAGGIAVGGRQIAEQVKFGERRLGEVRERTSDEWWRRAAEIVEAETLSTGGPLGLGVDFFADDMWLAVPDDVRQALQDEAYEAARDVIVEGLIRHGLRMKAALVAFEGWS